MKFLYNFLAILFCIITLGIFDLNIKYSDGSSFNFKGWVGKLMKGGTE